MLGHRPRPAGLRLPARPGRRHRGDRPHPRARGPRRRAALRAARDRHAAGHLRRPADRSAWSARSSTSTSSRTRRWRSCRRERRSSSGPFELELVHLSHSIPDMRGVILGTEVGKVLMTGDYKFDQTPVDGRPGRHLAARPARPRRPAVALRRLDQRRPPGDRAVGVERRAGAAGDLLRLQGPGHRHLLCLQHPPRAAGDRRRRRARPPRRPGRPLDAQELQHRLQPRHRQSARRASSSSRARSRTSPTRRSS